MSDIIWDRPRPWVIVIGVDPNGQHGQHIRKLAPSSRFTESYSEAALLRQSEYDAAIVVGKTPSLQSHLHVLRFSDEGTSVTISSEQFGALWSLEWIDGERAETFVVSDMAEGLGIGGIARQLAPQPGSEYLVLQGDRDNGQQGLISLLSERDGRSLAGIIKRSSQENSGVAWCLPDRALDNAIAWTNAAFRLWSSLAPSTFPAWADWMTHKEWMSVEELAVEAEIDEWNARHELAIAELQEERAKLDERRDDARKAADSGERRLLTTQSDELVSIVRGCLEDLGFVIVDSDAEASEAGRGKQEDLRVQDGEWVALAEVKGYLRRHAKASDLLQVSKAVETFVLRERRMPDARWYVINQSYETPPGQRRTALEGSEDLNPFAELGGLVIDTRDLFRLWRAVRADRIAPETARELLKNVTGRLVYRDAEPQVDGAMEADEGTGPSEPS